VREEEKGGKKMGPNLTFHLAYRSAGRKLWGVGRNFLFLHRARAIEES